MGVSGPMAFLQDHSFLPARQWEGEEHQHMPGGLPAQGGAPPPHIFPSNVENKHPTQIGDPRRKGTAPNISNYLQLRTKLDTTILKADAESNFSSQSRNPMSTLSSQVRAKSAEGLSLLLALWIRANTGNCFASSLTASYYLSFPKDNPGNKIKG